MATKTTNGATIGYLAGVWAMADALRGPIGTAGCKLVVLGLIFFTYISDAFGEIHFFNNCCIRVAQNEEEFQGP